MLGTFSEKTCLQWVHSRDRGRAAKLHSLCAFSVQADPLHAASPRESDRRGFLGTGSQI